MLSNGKDTWDMDMIRFWEGDAVADWLVGLTITLMTLELALGQRAFIVCFGPPWMMGSVGQHLREEPPFQLRRLRTDQARSAKCRLPRKLAHLPLL